MKEAVVTDSTCLIALERLGQLDLLPSLFVRAKRRGILDRLEPLLDQLETIGFHMSRELREEALRQASE